MITLYTRFLVICMFLTLTFARDYTSFIGQTSRLLDRRTESNVGKRLETHREIKSRRSMWT